MTGRSFTTESGAILMLDHIQALFPADEPEYGADIWIAFIGGRKFAVSPSDLPALKRALTGAQGDR